MPGGENGRLRFPNETHRAGAWRAGYDYPSEVYPADREGELRWRSYLYLVGCMTCADSPGTMSMMVTSGGARNRMGGPHVPEPLLT